MSALRDFRRPLPWLGGWLLLAAVVAVASLLPARDLPEPLFEHFDKLEHLLAYAGLSAYAVMLFAHRRAQALAVLALIAFGVVLELAQGQMTGTRIASSADALANSLGAFAGLLLAPTRWADALLRLERRMRPL